jgi:hypothetical protein
MKLGIMQPYFFPYLGYFDLINQCDQWLVFDIVSYSHKSWMNRNRILKPTHGWQYISLPIEKKHSGMLIQDTIVKDVEKTQQRILAQLVHYKKKAPFYNEVYQLVINSFQYRHSNSLVDINISAMQEVCHYLAIPFKYNVCSSMNMTLPDIHDPGHWALEIATLQGANAYINASGGKQLFNPDEYKKRGIELYFTEMSAFNYTCQGYDFIPNLSIIDVMMWNAPEKISSYLHSLRIYPAI